MPRAATTPGHEPVMLERVLGVLGPALQRPGAVAVDATLGLGGHSHAALERFPDLRLIGIDRDPIALAHSSERLAAFADRVLFVQATYDRILDVLAEQRLASVDAILMDLGVSSMQLDDATRGFSYARDTDLDMRMDPGLTRTAADVVNTASVAELTRILREYGEERFAHRIALRIAQARTVAPIQRSAELAELVRAAIPAPARRTGGNPAKRSFQALRIEVNDELGTLQRAMPAALDALAVHGRLAVLSYHSLEDRIVKRAITPGLHPEVPHGLPFLPKESEPWLKALTRGAEHPDEGEAAANPRAASARLRAVERLRVHAVERR